MSTDFNDAIAKVLPYYAPEYIFRARSNGQPEFPSLFGYSDDRIETAVDLYFGDLTLPAAISNGHLNLRRLQSFPDPEGEFKYTFNLYLRQRGDEKMVDLDAINADSNFLSDKLLDPTDPFSVDPDWPSDDRLNFLDHAAASAS